MAKIVTVEIDTDGNFSVDLTGFNGKGCSDVIKAFEGLGTATKTVTKPEFNSVKTNVVRQ